MEKITIHDFSVWLRTVLIHRIVFGFEAIWKTILKYEFDVFFSLRTQIQDVNILKIIMYNNLNNIFSLEIEYLASHIIMISISIQYK